MVVVIEIRARKAFNEPGDTARVRLTRYLHDLLSKACTMQEGGWKALLLGPRLRVVDKHSSRRMPTCEIASAVNNFSLRGPFQPISRPHTEPFDCPCRNSALPPEWCSNSAATQRQAASTQRPTETLSQEAGLLRGEDPDVCVWAFATVVLEEVEEVAAGEVEEEEAAEAVATVVPEGGTHDCSRQPPPQSQQ
jgi:hypothetical protein